MNDAIRMLQGARLYESSVFASVHQMDRLAAGAKIPCFIDTDLVIALSVSSLQKKRRSVLSQVW